MRNAVTDRLSRDHRNIERVLTLMRVQLDFLHSSSSAGLMLLVNAANYLLHYPGLLHHPLEELMFEQVVERDPSAADVLSRLRTEHASLTTKAADLVACVGLEQMHAGDGQDGLCRIGNELILANGDHMQYEEREVFPLAVDTLSRKQWDDIGARLVSRDDPLFSRRSLALYDNLYDALMAGQAPGSDG